MIDYSEEALREAAAGVPADRGLRAAGRRAGRRRTPAGPAAGRVRRGDGRRPNTSAALAVVHERGAGGQHRAGRRRQGGRGRERTGRGAGDARRARPRPARRAVAGRARGPTSAPVVDALVALALEQRQEARARKDWAAADAVRDQLAAAGIVVEDTPAGPAGRSETGRCRQLARRGTPVEEDPARTRRGNGLDGGQTRTPRRPGTGHRHREGRGRRHPAGQRRRGLEGRGPTPPAEAAQGRTRPPRRAAAAAKNAARKPARARGEDARAAGRPQPGGRGAARADPGHRALRRARHRDRRPGHRDRPDGRRPGHRRSWRSAGPSWTG